MKNIAMRLCYDGARYHGWQVQKSEITVAGTVEAALHKLTGEEMRVNGCGRTDAGVHAAVYCANFRTESRIPPDRLPYALSALLPDDIAVTDAVYAPRDFNATLSCLKKEYTYKICCSRTRDPFLKGRAHFYPLPLDLDAMRRAAAHLVGTRDFKALRSEGTVTKTTVRTMHYYEIGQCGKIVTLHACADGFLYNMARAIVGTLLYVSEGKILPDDIPRLMESRDRRLAGPTVPPGGLYLTRLWYDGVVGEMMSDKSNFSPPDDTIIVNC